MTMASWARLQPRASDQSCGAPCPVGVQVSEIIFFLLGAMTIVEIVDAHQGFRVVTDFIKTKSKTGLMWTIGILAFVMSSVLDNLTTTIVMVSLLRKLVPNTEARRLFGALVVIAANAGGAWTPIGDVTTTMLWINGQITALATMKVHTSLHGPCTTFVSHSIPLFLSRPPPLLPCCAPVLPPQPLRPSLPSLVGPGAAQRGVDGGELLAADAQHGQGGRRRVRAGGGGAEQGQRRH